MNLFRFFFLQVGVSNIPFDWLNNLIPHLETWRWRSWQQKASQLPAVWCIRTHSGVCDHHASVSWIQSSSIHGAETSTTRTCQYEAHQTASSRQEYSSFTIDLPLCFLFVCRVFSSSSLSTIPWNSICHSAYHCRLLKRTEIYPSLCRVLAYF